MRITAFGRTDVGKVRPENEDDYFVGHQVFAVADGMGGHVAGEVAAKTALEPVVAIDDEDFPTADAAEEALIEALRHANRQVVEKAEAQPELHGMGTTLTAGLLREGHLHLAHVGDSRAYLLRDGEAIVQLTTDHTLVERLVREGRLSRAEAATHPQRNVITRAIGNEPDVIVDSLPALILQPGDQVLLCSDGLTGPLDDAEIAGVLTRTADGDAAVDELVRRANEEGGPDNITVVLLRVETDTPATAVDGQSAAEATEPAQVHRITTRQDTTSGDWANRLGALGAKQGSVVKAKPRKIKRSRGSHSSRSGRGTQGGSGGGGGGKRAVAALLGVVLLLGVIAGGSWMLLSRAYFVGDHEGQVAIFRGIPQEVGALPLYRVMDDEVTDMPVAEFPEWRRERLDEGMTARTLGDARRIVDNLERNLGPVDGADNANEVDDVETDDPDDTDGDAGGT